MIQLFPDVHSILRDLSWITIVCLVGSAAYALVRLAKWWFGGKLQSHNRAIKQIGATHESISELLTEVRALHQESKICLAKMEELYVRLENLCSTDSCPMVASLEKRHDKIDRLWADVREEMRIQREEVMRQVKGVYDRFNAFTDELFPELVKVVRRIGKNQEN